MSEGRVKKPNVKGFELHEFGCVARAAFSCEGPKRSKCVKELIEKAKCGLCFVVTNYS